MLAPSQVQGSKQLIVVKGQNIVSDKLTLARRKGILENTIDVEFWFLHAPTEKSHPLFAKLKRVKVVIQVFSRHVLQEEL